MHSSIIAIRFGLYALTGAILGTTAMVGPHAPVTATQPLPMVTMSTITVVPSDDDVINAYASAPQPIPTLPTVRVTVTEEERLAALADPTDQIQVMAPITVLASADDRAAAIQAALIAKAESESIEGDASPFGRAIAAAVPKAHRLRLDMPYYSVGRVLTSGKN